MTKQTAAQRKAQTTRHTAVATFIAGALVSVAANIAAAEPTIVGRLVSAWPAIALLLTVHLFQHAQRSFLVKLSVLTVAAVAAYVSYFHMVEVATMAGETHVARYLLPLTVDAMMFVASVVATTKPKAPARRTRKAPVRRLRSVAA
jgi:hypothetical protein